MSFIQTISSPSRHFLLVSSTTNCHHPALTLLTLVAHVGPVSRLVTLNSTQTWTHVRFASLNLPKSATTFHHLPVVVGLETRCLLTNPPLQPLLTTGLDLQTPWSRAGQHSFRRLQQGYYDRPESGPPPSVFPVDMKLLGNKTQVEL
jgi:hypothetical protein